jgi:adenylate cyclase
MESHGTPGAVQITRATFALVDEAFVCEPQGMADIKGKGPMEIWHVVSRKPATSGLATAPSSP